MAKQEERVATLPGLGDSRWLASLTISADGSKVGFALEHGENRSGVWVVDLEKGTLLNVTRSEDSDQHGTAQIFERWPSLSDDGRSLAFTSDRYRDRDIFLADLEAHTLENLTRSDDDEQAPRLSVDGRRVLYWKDAAENPALYIFDRPRRRSIPVPGTEGAWLESASLSEGGHSILFRRGTGDEQKLVLVEAPE
jgi:Tol biopolymer transport system component